MSMPKPKLVFTIRWLPRIKCYVVVDPRGAVCSAPTSKDGAERLRDARQAEADRNTKRGPRACMCCGHVFDSEGIHNRMCPPCRHRGSYEGMSNPYSMGSMTGRRKSA